MKDIIPLMKIDDLEVRKLCCSIYLHMLPQTQMPKMQYPFSRFHSDPNPLLRVLSLKTMVSINRKEFLNLSITSCKRLFSDKDPDVRKSAAYAAGQIYQHDPARAEERV